MSNYTSNLSFNDHRKLYDRIRELEEQVKQQERTIAKCRHKMKIHRKGKYEQKLRVEKFLDEGGIDVKKVRQSHMMLLLTLVKSGVIHLTHQQIAEICNLSIHTVRRHSSQSFEKVAVNQSA